MSERKTMVLWMVEDRPATLSQTAKSFWTKVGVAFENRDGSYTLEIAALPLTGRLQMRLQTPAGDRKGEG